MAITAYENIIQSINNLTINEQLRLMEKLAYLIRCQNRVQPKRSILELKGLGKEIWSNMDAQEYVNKERASWNG
jgi:DNA-binding HxlR family transcriptional regulator